MSWSFLLGTRPTFLTSGACLFKDVPNRVCMLTCRRQVTLEEATAKAQSLNILFMETSAKAGHNVKSLFKKIAMSLPGMEKDAQNADAQNTSASLFDTGRPFLLF